MTTTHHIVVWLPLWLTLGLLAVASIVLVLGIGVASLMKRLRNIWTG